MSNKKLSTGENVLIGRELWDVPVRVELRAYLKFSRQMDLQLRRLVVRWAYAAPPSARGVPANRVQAEMPAPPTT